MEITIKINKKNGKTILELFNPDKLDNVEIIGILKTTERGLYNKIFKEDFEFKEINKES